MQNKVAITSLKLAGVDARLAASESENSSIELTLPAAPVAVQVEHVEIVDLAVDNAGAPFLLERGAFKIYWQAQELRVSALDLQHQFGRLTGSIAAQEDDALRLTISLNGCS